jgi:penicillin V acylase-like amidase (Ntn superfamily)
MHNITPKEIIDYYFGEGKGTGYTQYIDTETHNYCLDLYIDGKILSRYQTNDTDMLIKIQAEVEFMLDNL